MTYLAKIAVKTSSVRERGQIHTKTGLVSG
jgi:hypothetical protein